jgi:alkanesulfonate monooxygenase SsuD/methylene tetrahydromethanopterin reductase-like flavin-dependent oxidoreductase (luciferase family)
VIDVGVGLWTMRCTAARPTSIPSLYKQLQEDARLAERLGFHSLWIAEHHFWYDGWCPAALTAAASVLGATSRLRVGTGVHLLPLWDLDSARSATETLILLGHGRLELGVGLGYRDQEYDGFGIARRVRGRLMDETLDRLQEHWRTTRAGPPVMVGGFSDAALRRAASRGLGLFLPFSLGPPRLRALLERYRDLAAAAGRTPGRVGMLKYAWVTDGSARELERAKELIAASAREYSGAWFPLGDAIGFQAPEQLDKQLRLMADNALIGTPESVAGGIRELGEIGVDVVVLQVTRDDVAVDHRRAMESIAERVLPDIAAA